MALAIAIQNVPGGSRPQRPSWPRVGRGGGRSRLLRGLEPSSPAAFLAYGAASVAAVLLPFGLAFAAGAMLYVVVDELIPESHAHGFERDATYALAGGFTLMMFLDNVFG